ncbi:MAG: MFS transporter [Pseudohongiella sp.]|uniref:MFS transporter n=1 Tax=Pseudohongiella sp. TaxID=1979412 RepID=UPI00349FF209
MSSPRPNTVESPESAAALRRVLLLMILLNAFATPLMLSSANVALPSIARDLGLDAVILAWVPMAYLMASTIFVLIFGRIADTVGRKRIFLIGTAAVIVSSIYAAMSVNGTMLLSARFLQGVSAAMLYATQMALVTSAFPAKVRGKMIGLVVSCIYIGLSAGPLLGGYVIDAVGWRAAFLLQVPLALVVLLLGVLKVKGEWRGQGHVPFDLPGATGWGISIVLFCLGVSRLPDVTGLLILAASAISITLFLRHARRSPHPIWDVTLFFNNRLFTASSLVSLLMYSATYAIVVLMSLYLQTLQGLSATSAGMVLMIQPVIMALLAPVTGRLSDWVEPRILATMGITITTIGLFLLSRLDADSSLQYVIASLVMTGSGFSLFSPPNVNAIMGSVSDKHAGSASGAVATTRLIGQLNSMVLVTLALALMMGNTPISPETYPQLARAVELSFSIGVALCVPAIVLSLLRGRIHTPHSGA